MCCRKSRDKSKQIIGVIPIGASFTPVRKVSFNVESTRVGFKTDFERLTLEIWSNGTMAPGDALSQAAYLLETFFHRFVEFPAGLCRTAWRHERQRLRQRRSGRTGCAD